MMVMRQTPSLVNIANLQLSIKTVIRATTCLFVFRKQQLDQLHADQECGVGEEGLTPDPATVLICVHCTYLLENILLVSMGGFSNNTQRLGLHF